MNEKTKAGRDFRLSQLFWVITQRVVVILVPKRGKEITTTRCVIKQKNAVLIFSKSKFFFGVDIIPESQHPSESKS